MTEPRPNRRFSAACEAGWARLSARTATLRAQLGPAAARVGTIAGGWAALAGSRAARLRRFARRTGPSGGGAGAGRSRVRWRWTALALAMLVLGPAAYIGYAIATIPAEGGMAPDPSPSALTFVSGRDETFAARGIPKGEKIPADAIPPNLKAAIVAIEDRRFYSHHGIDLWGIGRAAIRNLSGGREGASTITQQLARLTHLSQQRSLRRKVQEAWLALRLEATLSKDEILARYLSAAYFGSSAWGADAAARRYFGKPARDLDLGEAALLAGLVRAPSSLAPTKNLDGARARAELVLTAMAEAKTAPPDAIEAARRNPPSIWAKPEPPAGASYFLDMIEPEARRAAPSPDVDLTVSTTLDLRLQAAAERVIAKLLADEGPRRNVSQAALVAMAPDGAVLAMVGGRDYAASQYNRAVQAKRQPGSLFKLFVYLTALEKGASPQTMAVDRPIQVGEWEPENYGGRYRGPVTLRTAFAQSINTVAVQVAELVGTDAVIATAKRLGVTTDLPSLPSLALGSAEVTLLDMVRAYGAVAFGREIIEPHGIRAVARGSAAIREDPKPSPKAAQPDQARADMTELLVAVVGEGTGKAARLPNIPVGGKTGTTQESRDAWFVGFMPGLVMGVWVGNDDNSPTKGVTGGDLPARIWRGVAGEAVRLHIAPPSLDERPTGSLASAGERPAEPKRSAVRGRATVRDTATLEIADRQIRLAGIEGIEGRAVRDFARYLRRREVICEPEGDGGAAYRCTADGQDLAQLVLFNGGGKATSDASDDLREAEAQARARRLGVWAR